MSGTHFIKNASSTNKVAYELAMQGEPEGTSVIAEAQREGRGRLGKSWLSPPGKGLYCSIIVRPKIPVSEYPKITLAAGLATALALEMESGLQIWLKWPNDVYLQGKKCCGILTESSSLTEEEDDKRFAIVGIGININSDFDDFPPELQGKVTSLRMASGKNFDIKSIFERVRSILLEKMACLQSNGFAEILSDWRKKDMLVGKKLQWVSTAGKIIEGVSEGPDDEGRLMVKDFNRQVHQVLSGDISLAEEYLKK